MSSKKTEHLSSIRERLRHAFAVEPPPVDADPSAPSPLPRSLERLADAAVERGLETPALILAGALEPVGFLAGQVLRVCSPLASVFLDTSGLDEVAVSLERRDTLPRLADRIETLASRVRPTHE